MCHVGTMFQKEVLFSSVRVAALKRQVQIHTLAQHAKKVLEY